MILARSSGFLRAYKQLIRGRPSLEKLFRERLDMFMADPFDPKLATHKLKGKMKLSWAFSLNWKLRVVFSFADSETVLLEDIGPHDKVY